MTDSKMEIDLFGKKRWRNSKGQLHRESRPAVIYTNGDLEWRINGKRHRIDGPAFVYSDGYKPWYLENFFVRDFSYD